MLWCKNIMEVSSKLCSAKSFAAQPQSSSTLYYVHPHLASSVRWLTPQQLVIQLSSITSLPLSSLQLHNYPYLNCLCTVVAGAKYKHTFFSGAREAAANNSANILNFQIIKLVVC
ncbi:hypothetical protein ILYODFUR_034312 [Ilyodon furcidens]|uniref:Uncharacterized protein n=1 Tax=Ilyodon furcidens TaxID=33524 RepID=A0ABV0VJH5_9TELE